MVYTLLVSQIRCLATIPVSQIKCLTTKWNTPKTRKGVPILGFSAWKSLTASFKKANRCRIQGTRGPGREDSEVKPKSPGEGEAGGGEREVG